MQLLSDAVGVKQSLAAHSWLGLLAGAFMYLICLSGSLAVFYPEFERWEQPDVHEQSAWQPAQIEASWHQLVASGETVTHHMFIALPTDDMPRASISSEERGWFLNPDGSRGPEVAHEWTHMLVNLHLTLHLPETIGMIVVSAFGALLCGLIVSGIMAHPRFFKDAFLLRLGGSRHLEQADLHNRLSVWGLPFHLMIGMTGAWFGLAAGVTVVLASAWFNGNAEAVAARLYGAEPELQQAVQPLGITRALEAMAVIAPGSTPFYITVEEADVPAKQYMIVGARHHDRLIWAEQYRFDAAGNYLGKTGYSDGEVGRQAIFSIYRIHFGHFGRQAVKWLYLLLGFSLTVVSVTGVNIWLARQRHNDHWKHLWTGLVWGAPLALSVAAFAQVLLGQSATVVFWLTLVIAAASAVRVQEPGRTTMLFQAATACTLFLLVSGYVMRFQGDALHTLPLTLNCTLLTVAACLGWRAIRHSASASQATPA